MPHIQIFPHIHRVDQSMRRAIKNHQPLVIWLTGLSGSGKSTLANQLEFKLVNEYQVHTYLLDGDNIRGGLNTGLGFSEADRKENIRRIGEVAKLMYDAGLIVITAFISPFREDRDSVRRMFTPETFWEVYISCPLEVCEERDPKGLYKKAINGEIHEFTGVTSPYESPLSPELVIETQESSVDASVNQIITRMVEKKIFSCPEKRD